MDIDAEPMQHRKKLFDVLFSDCVQDQRRRLVLEFWLNGDLRSECVEHYGPCDADQFLDAVVAAMVPAPIALFCRHRWLNSSETMRQVALLFSVHNSGAQAIPLLLQGLKPSKGGGLVELAHDAHGE